MHGTSRSTSATLVLTLALALMACAEGAADEPRHKAAGVGIGMVPCPTPAEIETAKLAFTFTVNGSDRFEAGTGLADVSRGSTLDLVDGATYDFSRDITAYDTPDHLRLHATGFDNDRAVGAGS